MTPAVDKAAAAGVAFDLQSYEHDPQHTSWGLEAAEKLGRSPDEVFKTLIVQLDHGEFAVAVLPVNRHLNLKRFAKQLRARKAAMAVKADAERVTGYLQGAISPVAQKKLLRTVLDVSAESLDNLCVSAGRRGYDMALSPADLIRLTDAEVADIADL